MKILHVLVLSYLILFYPNDWFLAEDYTKKNLALPTFVVLEPVAATQISEPACVHATNNKREEGDEGNVA